MARYAGVGTLLMTVAISGLPTHGSQQAQSPTAQAPAAGAPAPAAPQTPPAAGRGRGRGNPAAMLYLERCAGCHGTDTVAGRFPTLFDDVWVRIKHDDDMVNVIANGIPQTEMMPFKEALNDEQIWQLVAYVRTMAGSLKPRPALARPEGQVFTAEKQTFKVETVVGDLETPWGLAFLPDGRLLITERPGRLRIVDKGTLLPPVTGLPKVWERQDAGLFDVEVHPQYAKNGWIYLSYAEPLPGYTPPTEPKEATPAPGAGGRGPQPPSIPSMTVIVRGKINSKNEWVDQEFIYRPAPELFTTDNSHYGSRFTFDRQGHLFYSIGDRGAFKNAQDLSNPLGKIHRVNDDGSIPKDNPFVGKPGAVASIWSYGHRNPQGLAWDPVTGKLWESEHGPQGGDEINIIEPGKNYGWGVITHGVQNGITKRAEPGMEQPIVYYTPTIAPSGIAFYTGDRLPAWKNNLLVSGMAGQQLRRLEISGDKVTHQEVLFNQFGRVRDMALGPDGDLYLLLQVPGQQVSASTPGLLARLVPVKP